MSSYAVGDLQGCYDDFRRLLDEISFDPAQDRLFAVGDLVNRGPGSLQTLRFFQALGPAALPVLGNHDLHLLAVAAGHGKIKKGDTLDALLAAPDAQELLDWLASQPLARFDQASGSLIVHAGLAPQWDVPQTLRLADEVGAVLAGPDRAEFFARMYGDEPRIWQDDLHGWERLRFIVNCLTRLRYCRADGRLVLKAKGAPGSQPAGALPWFAVPGRRSVGTRIVFGHWSTLGRVDWSEHGVYGLDTGCIWGGCLTALELETGRLLQTRCQGYQKPGD